MSIEPVERVDVWRRGHSFTAMGAALMHASAVVGALQPPDVYAYEYALRLRNSLVAAERDTTISYAALRRPEVLAMTFGHGGAGMHGVEMVDEIITNQLNS
ncbi:MAG TPA: hypothetical protein VLF43_02015 [Candidatus Saccharimonadales bacterium]|nr:hypothetical protein [Candidatus Saccharimonadales bacterium]